MGCAVNQNVIGIAKAAELKMCDEQHFNEVTAPLLG